MSNLHKLKTLIPLHELEYDAQQQIYTELAHDFLLKLVIMPDCHTGYTLPIGGVALLDKVISPEYTGMDIGCGMVCFIFPVPAKDIYKHKQKIFDEIYNRVPVGFNCRDKAIDYPLFDSASGDKNLNTKVNDRLLIQLGTLGSGNHFIEIGENKEGYLAVVIHSGSRNIGHSIATYYMALSKKEDKHLPNGFLDLNSDFGQMYLQDLKYALDYALANRKKMLEDVTDILRLKGVGGFFINENHNTADVLSDGTVLHRKGATPADKDQYGVIPGNMRDGTYVTIGLGNEEYLSSASHGAGRKMSRKKAKENIDLDSFRDVMKDVLAKVDQGTLDEAPMAYKNLNNVIDAQKGIVVDVMDHIKPLINIKG